MTDTHRTVTRDLTRLITREIDTLIREVELFDDDDTLWRVLPGVRNSCGTLALHCAGNLQHYVGAVLGGSGYVRDRGGEFSQRTGTRADLVAELTRARAAVRRTLPELSAAALEAEFPEAIGGTRLPTHLFLMHLAVHLGFHVGQAGYLRRIMSGDGRTAGTVAVKDLLD
ncbi:MAG TPA: DinB family protein [Vicinamibacterales bacterium]|nr:DinB family protein [Vicinamibacterales bacterium]